MVIDVGPTPYEDIKHLQGLYAQEANCQIVHYSFLARGLADPYAIQIDGRVAGYGAVSNKYDKGKLIEFHLLPAYRSVALPALRELLRTSHATQIEAQTNMPLAVLALHDCARNIVANKVLFHDAFTSNHACPEATFRHAIASDATSMFTHRIEPVGDWVIETEGRIVATGGFLGHYNPPFADLYMEVDEPARRRGFGSCLIQELKRVAYEAGRKPAARCDVSNIASRKTLERAGMLPCGHLLVGDVIGPGA